MKRGASATALAGVLAAALACSRPPDQRQAAASPSPSPRDLDAPLPDPLPRVAAQVNGRPLGTSQVVVLAEAMLARGAPGRPRAYRAAVDQLVARELLLAEAIARGIAADAAAVERAYDEARVPYKEEAAWLEWLKAQALTPESYREELRVKLTVERLLAAAIPPIAAPSEQDLRGYYDRNPQTFRIERLKIEEILVLSPPRDPQARRMQAFLYADKIRQKIERDEGYEDLLNKGVEESAREIGRGELEKKVEDEVFALQPRHATAVQETARGFQVLKLVERVDGGLPPYELVVEALRQRYPELRHAELVQELAARLRAKAKVELFL